MGDELDDFLQENNGLASVTQLSEQLELPESSVRSWARSNSVPRLGSTFVFTRDKAHELADDLYAEEPAGDDSYAENDNTTDVESYDEDFDDD